MWYLVTTQNNPCQKVSIINESFGRLHYLPACVSSGAILRFPEQDSLEKWIYHQMGQARVSEFPYFLRWHHSQFEVVKASLEFIRNFCLQGVQTESRALQLCIPSFHLQSHTLLVLCIALRKTLQNGLEAEVPQEGSELDRNFLSLCQAKSAREPLITCCSLVLLSEYNFHGPPASVTN